MRFKNLREKWNNQQGIWAEIERIDIIDKAKERAALTAGWMPTPTEKNDVPPSEARLTDGEADLAPTEPETWDLPANYVAEESPVSGRGNQSNRRNNPQGQQEPQKGQPKQNSNPVRDALIQEGLRRIPVRLPF
jgi:hypothetical protein